MAHNIDIQIKSDVHFERLLSEDKGMHAALENAMREVMWEARNRATREIKQYMFDSAHDAHLAVRNSVYKKVIGGNINILNVRRALRRGAVKPTWRGRTSDTERILSYYGVDRGFILRFVNDGTDDRWTKNMDGHVMKRKSVNERPKSRHYVYPDRLGGRGGASRRNGKALGMFEKVADPIMEGVALKFQQMIDEIILERF